MDKHEHTGGEAPAAPHAPASSSCPAAPGSGPAAPASGGEAPANRSERAEQDQRELRQSFNDRISYICSAIALVVILIDLASYALGRADSFFTVVGIMVSIALLAIASLNRHSKN